MDSGVITIRFDIDPSKSRVPDENLSLASYLYDRFLTVDVFDGDSLFHYASCKVPLFEILRQGRSSIVKAKECEMCEPESGDFNKGSTVDNEQCWTYLIGHWGSLTNATYVKP